MYSTLYVYYIHIINYVHTFYYMCTVHDMCTVHTGFTIICCNVLTYVLCICTYVHMYTIYCMCIMKLSIRYARTYVDVLIYCMDILYVPVYSVTGVIS